MSIRPSYGKRSVLQVLSDGMSQSSPTGKSCCEESALTANELARRNEELAEAEGEIAAQKRLRDSEVEYWSGRAEKAEAERDELEDKLDELTDEISYWMDLFEKRDALVDELQDKLDDPYSEVNQKAAAWDHVEAHPVIGPLSELPEGDSYAKRVCKRLDQLEGMESAVTELQPAENRPTFAPAVPSWLGDVPDKPEVKRIVGDTWEVDGRRSKVTWSAEEFRRDGYQRIALDDAIESEQAATGDEANAWGNPPEVDRLAKLIWETSRADESTISATGANVVAKAIKDAGWTPPESEGQK